MLFEYSIVGGCLKIHKSVFVQELLVKDSKLRELLNWKSLKDFQSQHPSVDDPGEKDIISIDFTAMSVGVKDHPREIFTSLKAKYKEKIKGKVACRSIYTTFGGVYNFELNLNTDGDKIDYMEIG